MKRFRWLVLFLLLTTCALLPGLPASDAQMMGRRCPAAMQIQISNRQSQMARNFANASYQTKSIMQSRPIMQAQNIQRFTPKQSPILPRQVALSRTTAHTRSAPVMTPVTRYQTTQSQRVSVMNQTVRPHGPGGRVVNPVMVASRKVSTVSQTSRQVSLVPRSKSVTTYSRSVAQTSRPVAGTGSRPVYQQSRSVQIASRRIDIRSKTINIKPKTCAEQMAGVSVKWNLNCIACHQRMNLPYPTTRPTAPRGPQLVHVPQYPRQPGPMPPGPRRLPEPVMRRPQPPQPRPQVPIYTRIAPKPLPQRPLPQMIPGPRYPLTPYRPAVVMVNPVRFPSYPLNPYSPFRPTPTPRSDSYPWAKSPESPGTTDPMQLPTYLGPQRPAAPGKTGPKQLIEAITEETGYTRPIPTAVLEMPTAPRADGMRRLIEEPIRELALDHSNGPTAVALDGHSNDSPARQALRSAFLEDDLVPPDVPALPQSVLLLPPAAEEQGTVEDLDLEPEPGPSPFEPLDFTPRLPDPIARGPLPQSTAPAVRPQAPAVRVGTTLSLDAPTRSALPASVLGPG